MKYPELYKSMCLMQPLSESAWLDAEKFLVERKVSKQTKLLTPGEASDRLFIVLKGILRMYYTNDKGQEFNTSFTRNHDVASPLADMISTRPSRATVESIIESTVLEFNYEEFKKLQVTHPALGELYKKFVERSFVLRDQREYDFFILSIKERYERFITQFPEIPNLIPQYQIASFLGVTPVSLSRALGAR